jgi:hypothetical protein
MGNELKNTLKRTLESVAQLESQVEQVCWFFVIFELIT